MGKQGEQLQKVMSALPPNVLQNYFEGVARAILIQDQTKMSNVDSPHRSIGFDYCAIAMRQRVLQHIRGKSGHRADSSACPLITLFRHSATAVESPLDGLLLSPRRKAYQFK